MKLHTVPLTGHAHADVAASPAQLFAVASDPLRIGEWSHECISGRWLRGWSGPEVGARFRGHNKVGWWRHWSKRAEFTRVDAPRLVEWKTLGWQTRWTGQTQWTLEFTPLDGGGTRIEQHYRVLRGSWLLSMLYAQFLVTQHRDRTDALTGDLIRLGEVSRHE